MSVKLKRKCRFKCEINIPGFYEDEQNFVSKVSKRKLNLSTKMPPSIMENYDKKVADIFEKQSRLQEAKFSKAKYLINLIRLQVQVLSKKQLIEKLVKQMRDHLAQRETEIFKDEDTKSEKSQRERRKSQFYEQQSRMYLLEGMKERFEMQEKHVEGSIKIIHQKSQSTVSGNRSPMRRLEKKKSTLEQRLYEQRLIEHSNEERLKLQRVQSNVDKELTRLGLCKNQNSHSLDYRLRNPSSIKLNTSIPSSFEINNTKSQPLIKQFRTMSQVKDRKLQNNVVEVCQQELKQLSRMNNDIEKKRRTSYRSFKGIQNQLDSVGYYGFQKTLMKN